MTNEGVYVAGDYYLLCDICGFKIRRSEARKAWDGSMRCASDFEERHPQDTVEPRPERQNVIDARYADPIFTTDNAIQPEDL